MEFVNVGGWFLHGAPSLVILEFGEFFQDGAGHAGRNTYWNWLCVCSWTHFKTIGILSSSVSWGYLFGLFLGVIGCGSLASA